MINSAGGAITKPEHGLMKMHDLIIRGATLVDGTGSNPRLADVAVQSGRVSAIGQVSGSAAKMIDADGLVLAPQTCLHSGSLAAEMLGKHPPPAPGSTDANLPDLEELLRRPEGDWQGLCEISPGLAELKISPRAARQLR